MAYRRAAPHRPRPRRRPRPRKSCSRRAARTQRDRPPDLAPSSETPGGYVGQDFGELSRAAVLDFEGWRDVESKMWTGPTVCCPGGTNDRSQAIYCLVCVQSRIRPVGHGLIPTPGRLIVLIVARLSDRIIPYPDGTVPFSHRYLLRRDPYRTISL
jgi:hypothetical protein